MEEKKYKKIIKFLIFIVLNIIILSNNVYATSAKSQETKSQVFANGIYKLAVGKNSSKVIEVKGEEKSDNAIISIISRRRFL